MRDWKRFRRLRVLVHTVLLLALAFAVLHYSPLGSSDRADKYSQDLFNYYLGDWIYPDTHQRDSVVLLLTDEVVDKYQSGQWPARYDFHGKVLNRLLLHEPRAVFIDLYWMNLEKPGAGYLIRVLKRYRNKGIPVYIAAASSEKFYSRWPELRDLAVPVNALVDFDTSDFIARSYRNEYGGMPTAAFRMATDLEAERFAGMPLRTMDIFWATRPNPINESWMKREAPDASLKEQLTRGFTGINTQLPYTTTLFVRDLLNQVSTSEVRARTEADALIKGKVVLYGAHLSGVQDLVFTPNRDILPGVYYHAMALDNLLTWGGDYKSTEASPLPLFGTVPKWLLDLAILLPVVLVAALYYNGFIDWRRLPIARVLPLGSVLLSGGSRAVVIGLLCAWLIFWSWLEFAWLNVSAASWLGYVEVISYGFVIEKLDLIDRLEKFVGDRAENRHNREAL